MTTANEDIKRQMEFLVKKWEGKLEAPKMSPEWIERRTDRLRYHKLKHKLGKESQEDIAKRIGLF